MSSSRLLLALTAVACCVVPATTHAATLAVSDGASNSADAPKGGGHIALVDTTTGRVKRLVHGTAPAFSADGKRLAYATTNGLRVLTLATGRRTTLTTAKGDHDPVFSRDFKSVLFNRAPVLPPVTFKRCPPPVSDGMVPPCTFSHADYAAADDIYRVPAGGGKAHRVGGGCNPSPAPVGDAVVSLGPAGLGVGCTHGMAHVTGHRPPGSTRCHGRPLYFERSQTDYLRRAVWIGRASGILMVMNSGLALASTSATPVCDLIEVNDLTVVQDAAPSPYGRSVAMLYRLRSKTKIDLVTVATGRSRDLVEHLDIAATHIAWQPATR